MSSKKPGTVVKAPEGTTKYKALKTFYHDQLGRVEKGQEFHATPVQIASVRRAVEIARDQPE